MVPPPPRPILFDNLLLFAVFCCFFSMFKCVCFFLASILYFQKVVQSRKNSSLNKTLLFQQNDVYETSRKPKKQKNKTFQRMFGLRLMFVFFWFSSSFFVFFGHDLEKTKKTQGFLVFWINWWLKNCEKPKKLRSFLVFCMDCCYMSSKNLSKNQKKNLSFFGFLPYFK